MLSSLARISEQDNNITCRQWFGRSPKNSITWLGKCVLQESDTRNGVPDSFAVVVT